MNEKSVELGSTTVRYIEKGRGAPLLCIHGNTGSRRWYERVMDIPGARVIALDLPNFGASDPLPGTITMDAYAEVVAAFVRALGLEAVFVAAHSLGGAVAMSLVTHHAPLVRGLLLVDSSAPSGLLTPVERHPAIELMRTNRAILAQALRAVVPTLTDEAFFTQLVDDAARMAAPAWIGNAVALGHLDYAAGCAAYKGPVIVAWGRKDLIITESMARATAVAFPNAHLDIVDEVGHGLMVEKPARFVALAERLVTGRSGA
jgi:pimeloyl-ACP methyl ester carboxylesterase